MKLPLHIKPDDFSDDALSKRYELHTRMMALNPNGWPMAPTSKKNHHKVAAGVAARYGQWLSERVSSD